MVKILKSIVYFLGRFGGIAVSSLIDCCGDLIRALLNGDIDIAQASNMLGGIKQMLAGVIAIPPKSLTMADAVAWRAAVMQLMVGADAYGALWVINDQAEMGQRIRAEVAAAQAEMFRLHWSALPPPIKTRAPSRVAEMVAACRRHPIDRHAAIEPEPMPDPEPEPDDTAAHKPQFGWHP